MLFDFATIKRVWLLLVAGSVALGFLFQKAPGPHGWMRWFGLAVALIGFAGVILSRYTLGRSFSIAPKATELVTTGLYSRIRNPIYVSGMLYLAGLVLLTGQLRLLGIFLILIPMQVLRARREAAVLEARFGDAYREYRNQTWF